MLELELNQCNNFGSMLTLNKLNKLNRNQKEVIDLQNMILAYFEMKRNFYEIMVTLTDSVQNQEN